MPSNDRRHKLLNIRIFIYVLFIVAFQGCANNVPYNYDSDLKIQKIVFDGSNEQIERGDPHELLDLAGWILGIPSKIFLWNRKIDNHQISEETEKAISEYIEKNGLVNVKVRLNQYHPIGEIERLRSNTAIHPGWRCTIGLLFVFQYTLLPGRLLGGDNYNPYTNTISIYSDVPSIALHEGGHAKDIAQREHKGAYSASYIIPVVPLWHEAVASNDVFSYYKAEGNEEGEKEAYKTLYPAYGSYIGSTISTLVKGAELAPVATVGVGHVIGRNKASKVKASKVKASEIKTPKEKTSKVNTATPEEKEEETKQQQTPP